MGPWQHTMSQPQGPQQQQQSQQLQQIGSPQGTYQGYPTSLDPEDGQGGLTSSVGLGSQQASVGRPSSTSRHGHDFVVSPDQSSGLGPSLGLGLGLGGQHPPPEESQTLGAAALGMGGQDPPPPLAVRRPKREQEEAEGGATEVLRAHGKRQLASAQQQGSVAITGGLEPPGGCGGGGGGNGEGEGFAGNNGGGSLSTFVPEICGGTAAAPYPAHLGMGMRTSNGVGVSGTPAPCSSVPTDRNAGGGGGRDVTAMGSGGDAVNAPHPSCAPPSGSFRDGGPADRRVRSEDAKVKRWAEPNGVSTGAGQSVEVGHGGRGGADERAH